MCKILKNLRIIDNINSQPIEETDIVIKENKIIAVGKKKEKEFPMYKVIDLSGKTILPGLINMHAHLIADDTKEFMSYILAKTDEELLLQAVRASRLALKSGITTVRDCGSRNNLVHSLRDAIHRGELTGPRIISCGMPVTITGGHCFYIGIEADGVDEIRKAVRLLVKKGADFIKVMVTGGGCTPHTDKKAPSFTDEELFAAVDETHRNGKKVAVHAHGTRGIIQAVNANVDTIEHCSFLTEKGMKAEINILQLIKEKGITIVPTISGTIRLYYEGSFTISSFDQHAIGGIDFFHERFDLFREFLKSGINIVAGTDSGIQGTPHNDFVSELEMMVELGMKEEDVIKAATSKASQSLGLESEIGTIEKGKIADLLVLHDNPLQNFQTLSEPYIVIANGEIIDKQV